MLMRVSVIATAVALFGGAWPAFAQTKAASTDKAAAMFGAREDASHMSLSPSGKYVAFITPARQSGTAGMTADLGSGALRPFISSATPGERLDWCRFVTDERLICRYSANVSYDGSIIPMSRLIAVNRDGSGQKLLGQQQSDYDASIRQFDGSIIDWLPGQDGSVLMAKNFIPEAGRIGTNIVRKEEGLAVVRIDTATLQTKKIEPPNTLATDYLSDGRGVVRVVAFEEEREGKLTGRIKYNYRAAGSREWKALSGMTSYRDFQPLAVDATSDSIYVLKPLDGRLALYRVSLGDKPAAELIAAHPKVDIDDVVRSANGQRVIGYSYADDKREVVYFDEEAKKLRSMLGKALPKLPLIDFIDASADGSKLLIYAGSDTDPGRYYVFDRTTKSLDEVLASRLALEGQKLAPVKPVSIPLGDGSAMPAYLTLPVGKIAKNLPAVVLPHGGPSSRDEWGFDWLVQYLAMRGYAVLQPNYRGSAGFGEQWMQENGFRGWKTSVGDVTTGARWLASQGIADPKRMAIVGWSYGGYAALQAAATEPELFKSVAAIAPVTDLAMLKLEAETFNNQQLVSTFIGSGPHIREGSPLQRAGTIKVPVLLAHGDLDINVGVNHSARMEKALSSAGTPVQFLRYKGLDHQLDDSAARTEMLTAIGGLLEQSIGR